MAELNQNSSGNKMFLMIDSSDHITGKTGATLTVTISKAGAAFNAISPVVTERGNGWYSVAYVNADTDTLGDLAWHVTATGADPTDEKDFVVDRAKEIFDYTDAIEVGLTPRQTLRLLAAALGGEVVVSGTSITFRNAVADSKTRITATADSFGQRSAVTTDLT